MYAYHKRTYIYKIHKLGGGGQFALRFSQNTFFKVEKLVLVNWTSEQNISKMKY